MIVRMVVGKQDGIEQPFEITVDVDEKLMRDAVDNEDLRRKFYDYYAHSSWLALAERVAQQVRQ